MKNHLTNEDLVSRYLDKEMSDIERLEFENSMANDPSSTQWRNVGFPDHIKRVLDLHKNIIL